MSAATTVHYKCDWTDEFGEVCGEAGTFAGGQFHSAAREAGWGSYTNAHVRRIGSELWFCPVHATLFRNNHGWGDLEDFKPPKKWWESFYRKQKP